MSDIKPLRPEAAQGLDLLYRRYAAWLGGRLRPHVGLEEAAEVVQETYLRAAPYDAADIRHPKAFLLRIALNLVRDQRRRDRRRPPPQAFAPEDATPAPQIQQLEIKQALLDMPSLYRDVFVMSRFGGMTYSQIADALGVSVKTVEWRMSKAIEHCMSRLDL